MTIQLRCVEREGGRGGEGSEERRVHIGGVSTIRLFFLCRSGTCVTCVLLWTLSDRIVV